MNFLKRFLAIHELFAIGLRNSNSKVFTEAFKAQAFNLLTLL